MKRFICGLTLVGAVFAAMVGCGKREAGDELQRIGENRHLYVAVQPVNVPFGFSSGTKVIGFDADLAEAIAGKLNVPVRWVKKTFEELFDTLAEKKADIIVSAITITDQRKQRFAFSDPYFQSGQILAVRKDNQKEVRSLNDLKGKKVGVSNETTGHMFAQSEPRLRDAEIVTAPSIDSALLRLNNRVVDAVIGDFPIVVHSVEESFPTLSIEGRPLTNEQYGVVLRKGEDQLLKIVNEIVEQLKSQGKLEEMGKKWFKNWDKIKKLQKEVPGKPLG
ncbi:MAG TPA: ABC transporter substrate-binding protein [Acidobacteriota bacterium]|nr:ABC transporter substrate-binding protein [Acidobacteriota bacterium]